MKKRKTLFVSLSIISFCLISCNVPFNKSSSSSGGQSNSSTSGNSSYTSSNPISDANRAKLRYTYKDYTENCYYTCPSTPSIGEVKCLVVPIQLKNTTKNVNATTIENIRKAYFGTEEETGWHSVSTFYEDESYGKLKLSGTVTDWYQASYGIDINDDQLNDMVQDVVSWYKKTYNTDCSEFDSDNDGYIDSLNLVYNVGYENQSNDMLWAFTFWSYKENVRPTVLSPIPCQFTFASCEFLNDDYGYIDAHTFIHEQGHMFGLDDYYNYNDDSSYGAAGGFSMQDYNIGSHDPYSKMALGWIEPQIISEKGKFEINLSPASEAPDCLVLTNKTIDDFISPFDEYLIVEFYTPTRTNYLDSYKAYRGYYPKGPKINGIRLWHVDARLAQYNYSSGTWKSSLTNTISSNYWYLHATSNTTGSGAPFEAFKDYRLLHLLQKGGKDTLDKTTLSGGDLFVKGDEFSMLKYNSLFANKGRLNSNESLNYTFKVDSISDTTATLTVERK